MSGYSCGMGGRFVTDLTKVPVSGYFQQCGQCEDVTEYSLCGVLQLPEERILLLLLLAARLHRSLQLAAGM